MRRAIPDAGGLAVATNIRHANQIAAVLRSRGEDCLLVTTRTPGAQQIINDFRSGIGKWIVAVGMISEGTDIPRLQVCCYLSRIRTELHYRQVLGRVLRRTGEDDHEAWLFVLAEPSLLQFSQRVAEDLPDDLAVLDYMQLVKVGEEFSMSPDSEDSQGVMGSLEFQVGRSSAAADEQLEGAIEDEAVFRLDVSSGFRTEILSVY
ncbi:DEAD/DEAH box helicase [Pseudomonas putida]